MSETEKLVERLERAQDYDWHLHHQAASALRSAEARIRELEAIRRGITAAFHVEADKREAAEAQVAKARECLTEIAEQATEYEIARAAASWLALSQEPS